ncbi:MAG: DUF92 domain-containing protein [Anaerolineae bacterium]|nr:MAG: DUF92 domain-containing protein [Anaerolineae bacterium]
MSATQPLFGFLFALVVAVLAYRAHSLSRSGAWAATVVGTLIFGLGGWRWAVLLLTFFISSSALSHAFATRKHGLSEKFAKGSQRDWGQVFGNGAVAAFFSLLHSFYPQATWPWVAFAASLAAVNADTWATELGVLSPSDPHLITDLRKRVDKGTSGGISPIGSLAALGGAALIGLLAGTLSPTPAPAKTALFVTLSGFAGALFDSFLGATVQAIYLCPTCAKETERHPTHLCGAQTALLRGWRWLNNDWVNFACAAFGAGMALLLFAL